MSTNQWDTLITRNLTFIDFKVLFISCLNIGFDRVKFDFFKKKIGIRRYGLLKTVSKHYDLHIIIMNRQQ